MFAYSAYVCVEVYPQANKGHFGLNVYDGLYVEMAKVGGDRMCNTKQAEIGLGISIMACNG